DVFVVPDNLIPEGCERIRPDMLPLVDLSQEEIDGIADKVPGGAANIQDIYPLGPLQEGILFHHMLGHEDDTYLLTSSFRVSGRERVDELIDGLQKLIARHDI